MSDYKILIERGDQKLLFLEGPLEVIAGAVSGFLDRELKAPKARTYANGSHKIVRFTDDEDERLIKAVADGVRGKKLREVLPKRPPPSIRSRIVLLGERGKIDPSSATMAVVGLGKTK